MLAQKEIKEWRGGKMGFVMGLLGRYAMFTTAVFVVGGVMGWFFDGEESIIVDGYKNIY